MFPFASTHHGSNWMLRPSVVHWLIACLFLFFAPVPARAQAAEPETFARIYQSMPGPWGDLQYYHVRLEVPGWMVDSIATPGLAPKWYFPRGTEASLRSLFQKAGLSGPFQEYLLAPAHREIMDSGITVYPPVADIVAMTPEQRSIIYSELAKSEVNTGHANPLCITNGDPNSWFAHSNLRPELIEMAKKLTYMQGEMLCFSDLSILLGMARSKGEARDIVRTMNRTSAVVLQLKLKGTPHFEQMVRYWTADGRNKDAELALRSAADTENNEGLDVSHLLPSLPRRYLYSYYAGDVPIVGTLPNCHWTSLNFFNITPLDYHRDPRLATLHVNEDYAPVPEPYRFGDVLMFLSPGGFPLHSCVYIAADIVYTKNGHSATCPWILMKLADVKRRYSRLLPATIRGYRLRNTPEQEARGE